MTDSFEIYKDIHEFADAPGAKRALRKALDMGTVYGIPVPSPGRSTPKMIVRNVEALKPTNAEAEKLTAYLQAFVKKNS